MDENFHFIRDGLDKADMFEIAEYNKETTFYELFFFLYVKIMKKEVTTFEQLVSLTERIPLSYKKEHALKSGFHLIRKLNWGFFSQLTLELYPKLYERLTIENRDFSFGADLKRNMTITNIYISFIDIHGYTAFCFNSGINTSRLQKLDDFIEQNITKIAKENHVISRRIRGDEIIIAGSSALDIVETTVQIADYFSARNIVKSRKIINSRSSRPVLLPDMSISAGIAGGKKYTPLIITSDGDLSGTVVNTAARLQAQANKMSKDTNRILTANHVVMNFKTEAKAKKDPLLTENLLGFFNAGVVSFKGIKLTVNEIIIDEREKYRIGYQDKISDLIDSLEKNLWGEDIFANMVDLICTACYKLPSFTIQLDEKYEEFTALSKDDFIQISQRALYLFLSSSYEESVAGLNVIIPYLKNAPGMDYFVAAYSESIIEVYQKLVNKYQMEIEKPGDAKISKKTKKSVWKSVVDLEKKNLAFELYFGK